VGGRERGGDATDEVGGKGERKGSGLAEPAPSAIGW